MNIIKKPPYSDWKDLCERPALDIRPLMETVQLVFDAIEKEGDQAVGFYTRKFDQVTLESFKLTPAEIAEANQAVSSELQDAIRLAYQNIQAFHSAQKETKEVITTSPGVECWREARPIEKVGIYIPGGTAPLFSTILMLGVPAQIAGCKEIILCTPPNKEGKIAPEMIFTANLLGIKKVFKVGGIQAIAALSLGTESIPQVYKIFGPGNQYVTAAKQYAQQLGTAIDMPAGPSELMVIADETAVPAFVASDLLSQAEHGTDSQVVCLCSTPQIAMDIQKKVALQVEQLERKAIAKEALNHSQIIVLESKEKMLQFCNAYAPEHLILCTAYNDYLVENVMNAGSVFIGNYTPESAGDYASGTNHTLPTNGFARSYSGVSLDAFIKKITFQKITKSGIQNIGPAIEQMAAAEQLQAHKNAVTIRLKMIDND